MEKKVTLHPRKLARSMAKAQLEQSGVSRNTFQHRKKQPTTEWSLGELLKAAAFLGIDPEDFHSAIRYRV